MVVFETDKSGRFSTDSPENYRVGAMPHVQNDMVIDMKDHDQIETKLNAHATMWMRMLNAGEGENQTERIRHNMTSQYSPVAPLYVLRKDHKTNFDPVKGPPGRPVCGATGGLNEKFSYLLSMILDKVWQDTKHTSVCMSTEEMLASVDQLNADLLERGVRQRVVIGSADVKALYPSLDIDFTVSMASEMFEASEIQLEGVDYDEMGLYLAFHRSVEELEAAGVGEICPRRRYSKRPPEIQSSGIKNDVNERFAPWLRPTRLPTDWQKRRMVTESLKVGLSYVMKNHVYLFDGGMRKQIKGGPIGLKLTGTLAQVFMVWWDGKFREKIGSLNMEILLYKRYVDDINICSYEVEPGTKYENGNVIRTGEDDSLDADERCFEILKSVGDSIHESIQLEVDYPSKHNDGKIPILDVKVYIDGGSKVMYEFYAKDVSSKHMINAKSALPWSMKRTVLTQEVLRVLLNCSPELDWQVKVEHIECMVKRMQFSGYTHRFRFEVVNSAINAYHKIEEDVRKGERPLHRHREWKKTERDQAKEMKNKDWYRKGGYDSVIFIPGTPNAVLRTILQEEIDRSTFKIRVVEHAGRTLKQSLQRSDPFKSSRCRREDCPVCESGGKGRCDMNSALYCITCTACGDVYHGESGRNTYVRCREHRRLLENKSEESPLWKHCVLKHGNETTEFKYDVLKTFRNDAMLRQISESVAVNRVTQGKVMNAKTEWNQPRVPRASIQ